jgi:hypothetical protein
MLPSPSLSTGTSPEKTTCLIVSLDGQGNVFSKTLAADERMKNCIIISLELLKEIQPYLSTFRVVELKELIKSHQQIQSKIKKKDMGVYGKGAFANKNILIEELIIYSGRILKEENTKINQSESVITVVKENAGDCNFVLDGSLVDGLAKLFQHLPRENSDSKKATQNFITRSQCIQITYKHKRYLLPIVILIATKNITRGMILGYDYGNDYWLSLKRAYSSFTVTGEPIRNYCLRVEDPNKDHNYFYLNPVLAERLLEEAFLNLEKCLYILPADSLQQLKDNIEKVKDENGTSLIDLHSCIEMEKVKFVARKTDKVNLAMLINDKAKALASDDVFKFFNMEKMEADGKTYLLIPMKNLTQASTQELASLEAYLKIKVSSSVDLYQTEAPILKAIPPQPTEEFMPVFSVVKHSLFKNIKAMRGFDNSAEDALCLRR